MTARIAAAVSGGAAPVDPTRRRHACADGAVFAATFEGERAIVEVLGRAPLVLARVPVESGFRYGDGRRSLRGLGEEASWQVGDDVPVSCTIASSALALRLAPGDHPLFDPATRADGDWSRLLLELMPAIRACLARSVSHLPRVVRAWPSNRGKVGVRLQSADGGREQCIATGDGRAVDEVRQLPVNVERLPGEGDVVFTPAVGAHPAGACFRHERVVAGWTFLGWLSTRTCQAMFPRAMFG